MGRVINSGERFFGGTGMATEGKMILARGLAATALAIPFLCCGFVQELTLNLPVQIRLEGDRPVTLQVPAHAGEYVRVVVLPEGIPLRIRLLSPSGREVMSFLNESGDQKVLPVAFLTGEEGIVGLEFSIATGDASPRTLRYAWRSSALRPRGGSEADRSAA
jgi:hypothetical protein